MPKLTETIMKSSKVSRVVISASLVAVVGLLTYNWAVSPQASYLNAAQQYEQVSQDVDTKVKILNNTIRVRKKTLEKLRDRMQFTGSTFFTAEQATDFFGRVEKISTDSGCNLESMVFINGQTVTLDKNDRESPNVTEKKAVVEITAAYGEIIKFIVAVNNYPLTVYIKELDIRSINASTDKLSCSMILKVYLTKDKELLLDE